MNDEFAGSCRNNGGIVKNSNGTDGVDRPTCLYDGSRRVCKENETFGNKIFRPYARKFYLFIQTWGLRFLSIIKRAFQDIGEAITDTFEHPLFRAAVFDLLIVILIVVFIEIGYMSALYDYGIVPEIYR